LKVDSRHRRRDEGQALVELALVTPLLFVLLFAIIDFGWALRAYVTINNASREGARFAVVCNADTAIVARTIHYAPDLLTSPDVTVTFTPSPNPCNSLAPGTTYPDDPPDNGKVQVRVQHNYSWISPLPEMASILTGGAFPSGITLKASTTMRFE
jgi:Flp pilus assembly protein TadG